MLVTSAFNHDSFRLLDGPGAAGQLSARLLVEGVVETSLDGYSGVILRNPFARLVSGLLVHAGRVHKADGPFACPACEAPLRLRAGEVIRKHFAHEPGAECSAAVETFLHRYAKDLLSRELRLRLPARWATWDMQRGEVAPEAWVSFDRAEIEVGSGDVRPDLILYRNHQGKEIPLIVEIKVTHGVGAEKVRRLVSIGISAIEIDLDGVDLFDPGDLDGAIVGWAPRKWLFHRSEKKDQARFRRMVEAKEVRRSSIERQQRMAAAERAIANGVGRRRRPTVAEVDRENALEDLRLAVVRRFPRDGRRAQEFMERGHRGLLGQSPASYCRNRETLEECLALLSGAPRSFSLRGAIKR